MAHQIEPMDIDESVCDFDDKENSFHHNNVLPRTPCTEKGYEELDVSELNMKLRYSISPAQSPMSKSYTANCLNNEIVTLDCENGNMTRSLHSALTNNDTINKSQKSYSQFGDSNRNILQPLDSTSTIDKITVTVTGTNEIDDNLSFPSSSDHTPEATTPTKEIPKEEGSPIMRGLKSVLSMFRPSQSPIPPDNEQLKQEAISPPIVYSPETSDKTNVASASTPLVAIKTKDPLKRNSSHTENLVFNEGLATELEWKDDFTILSGNEKVPIHKLLFQLPNQSQSKTNPDWTKTLNESEKPKEDLNVTEYMEVSYNDSGIMDKTNIPNVNVSATFATESDGEFVDAESSIQSESQLFKSETAAASLEESIPYSAQVDNLNITTETLSAGIPEPTDLSSASADTIKIEKSATLDETQKETVTHGVTAQVSEEVKEETHIEELGKVDSRKSDNIAAPVTEPIPTDNFKSFVDKEKVSHKNEVGLSPVTDNVVVSSLAQIPLIADPRVLLFNISPGFEDSIQDANVKDTSVLTDANTEIHAMSPADVPLPDDDDMASLPSMNCALDNISQALDKISEEIPKINRQAVEKEIMQSVTSAEKLLDLTLSSLPEPNIEASCTMADKGNVEMNLPVVEESVKPLADLDEVKPSTLENTRDESPAEERVLQPNSVGAEAAAESEFKFDETQAVIDLIDELTPMSANDEKQILNVQNDVEPMDTSMAEVTTEEKVSDSDVYETSTLDDKGNEGTNLPLVQEIKSLEEKTPAQENTVDKSSAEIKDLQSISVEEEVAPQPAINLDDIQTVELPDKISTLGDNRNLDINLPLAEEAVAILEEKPSALENTVDKTLAEAPLLGPISETTIVELMNEPSILVGKRNVETKLPFMEQSVKYLAILGEENTQTVDQTPAEQPISVKAEVALQPEIKLDGPKIDEQTPVPPNVENQSLTFKDAAPIGMSMAEIHNTDQTVIIEKTDVANGVDFISDAIDMPVPKEISGELKETQKEQNLTGDMINEDIIIGTGISEEIKENGPGNNVSANKISFAASEKPDRQLIESNIEFIKQEVDVIIAKAVDIVNERIAVQDLGISSEHENIPAPAEPKTLSDHVTAEMEKIHADVISENNEVTKDSTTPLNLNTAYENINQNNEIKVEMRNSNLNLDSVSVEADQGNAEIPIEEPVNDVKNSEIVVVPVLDTDNVVKDSIDEEIHKVTDGQVVASKNNSPFELVSHNEVTDAVATDALEKFEEVENPYTTSSEIKPPSSPAIVSKGYNFNFDEIDDPFATKPKISMSPPPAASLNRTFEQTDEDLPKKVINRRKSQPERKKPAPSNKKMNSTFGGKFKTPAKSAASPRPTVAEAIESTALQIEQKEKLFTAKSATEKKETSHESVKEKQSPVDENATPATTKEDNINEEKSTLEKSAYSSVEPKSTYNVPEFDDPNLNPFTTKSKVRQSPQREDIEINPFATRTKICQTPPPQDMENPFVTKTKICSSAESSMIAQDTNSLANNKTTNIDLLAEIPNSIEMRDSALEENDKVLNSTTTTSKSEQDNTFNTVNTEDEDTIEGPFLEAEEFNTDSKIPNFVDDNVDMMRFSTGNEGTTDAGDEMFIDAEAFEFLLNQNQTNAVSDSGKESLFLKFDPLFAKRMSSDGVLSALNRVQKKQSTPKKSDKPVLRRSGTFDKSPVPQPRKSLLSGPSTPEETERSNLRRDATFDNSPGPSNLNTTEDLDLHNGTEDSYDDLNVTVSKPMMVVNPAVNAVVTPRNKSLTPVRSNRQSLTFTSPAIAVIDRLLSMSTANNSFMTHDTTVAEVRPDNEADLALTQLRELLADKEISVYNLRSETKELQNRLTTMESQMKNLETISEERLKKINELNEKLDEKTRLNKSMAKVVEEYERTIASLIAETEQDKLRHAEERMQLIKERDEQSEHLASMEISFNDLHSKYEKSKQIILGFKANEDSYKKSIKEFEDNLSKMQKNYELLKQHATSKLNYANEELQKMNRAHESEVLKLNAMIKRKELHITSLEETLQQKTKANEELTAICDELINKVG